MQTKNKLAAAGGAAILMLGLFAIAKPAITAVYSTPMRDVDNARLPITAGGIVTLPNGTGSSGGTVIYTVPAGSVLVIDSITAKSSVPNGLKAQPDMTCDAGSQMTLFPTMQYFPWGAGQDLGYGTQRVTCYATAGKTIGIGLQRLNDPSDNGGTVSANISFSGHLISLP